MNKDHRAKLLAKKTPAEYRFEKMLDDIGVKYEREFPVETNRGKTKYIDFFVGRKLSYKNKNSQKAVKRHQPAPYYGVGFEIDGGIHDGQQSYDIQRDTEIVNKKLNHIFVFRFTNDAIFDSPEEVKSKVVEVLSQMGLLKTSAPA